MLVDDRIYKETSLLIDDSNCPSNLVHKLLSANFALSHLLEAIEHSLQATSTGLGRMGNNLLLCKQLRGRLPEPMQTLANNGRLMKELSDLHASEFEIFGFGGNRCWAHVEPFSGDCVSKRRSALYIIPRMCDGKEVADLSSL